MKACAGRCLEISIHALREEGDAKSHLFNALQVISIHALREEGDIFFGGWGFPLRGFLSTPSARRATHRRRAGPVRGAISIHALREEGDLEAKKNIADYFLFLSTPSARRAT